MARRRFCLGGALWPGCLRDGLECATAIIYKNATDVANVFKAMLVISIAYKIDATA
jgi:hypothetical protein